MEELTYTYSQISSQSIRRLLIQNYGLPESINCNYYVLGLHDNYLIEGNHGKYILRIYRNEWRSSEEIQFELDLLAFLGARDGRVAYPLSTKTGTPGLSISCPEGQRMAVLFHYADGFAPGNKISIEQSTLLGEAVAHIHHITESYEPACARQVLDVPYLLDDSILAIEPYLGVQELEYLYKLQKSIKRIMPSLPRETGIFGICAGDVNPGNFHINDKKEITLFDFDQCGYGFRAFEIGKYLSSIHSVEAKHDIANAFVDGYQNIRQLSEDERMAIPYFEIISVIWVMAIHAYNANRIGYKWLEKPFWDRKMSIVKELVDSASDRIL